MKALVVTSHVTLPVGDLTWTAVRSSGAGGQNVNKVSSKVELRFDLDGNESLDDAVKARVRRIAASRIDRNGFVVVTSQLTRDQHRNLDDARHKLAVLIARALSPQKTRRPTRPTKGAVERRLSAKHVRAEKKRDRRTHDEH